MKSLLTKRKKKSYFVIIKIGPSFFYKITPFTHEKIDMIILGQNFF